MSFSIFISTSKWNGNGKNMPLMDHQNSVQLCTLTSFSRFFYSPDLDVSEAILLKRAIVTTNFMLKHRSLEQKEKHPFKTFIISTEKITYFKRALTSHFPVVGACSPS